MALILHVLSVLFVLLFLTRYVYLVLRLRGIMSIFFMDGKPHFSTNWRRVPGIWTFVHVHTVFSSPWPYSLSERWRMIGIDLLMKSLDLFVFFPLRAIFPPTALLETSVSRWLRGQYDEIEWSEKIYEYIWKREQQEQEQLEHWNS